MGDLDRFVVTGCGRSGTQWMARALTYAGVPCGHEQVYNAAENTGQWPDDLRADSSWMATVLMEESLPVVAVVRHPLLVVKSWTEIGFFTWDMDNPTHDPLFRAYPDLYTWERPQDRALDMWYRLTLAALDRAELIFRTDRMTVGSFGRLLGWAGVDPGQAEDTFASVPRCNRHEESRSRTSVTYFPTWAAHDRRLASRAQQLSRTLGYGREVG